MERFVLEVNHYRKEYGDHIAVRDLSLSVAPGESCDSIGHKDTGKTTHKRTEVSLPHRVRCGFAVTTCGATR